jgi:hypothetical protein
MCQRDVAIWQLADDEEEYGEDAGKFILVSPDGEDEPVASYIGAEAIFDSEEEAEDFASVLGWHVVPLNVGGGA